MFMGQCLYARDFTFIISFVPDNRTIVELGESTGAQGGNCPPEHTARKEPLAGTLTPQFILFCLIPFLFVCLIF